MNKDLVICLNILYLLKSKPMKYEQLWKSGYFRSKRDLDVGMRKLCYANCVEKIDAVKIYVILGHDLSFLSVMKRISDIESKVLVEVTLVPLSNKDIRIIYHKWKRQS